MLCQACGRRPATVNVRRVQNGKVTDLHLCNSCAEERSFFNDSLGKGWSLFDSFFSGSPFERDNVPFGGFREPERINIVDYFSERAKKVVAESMEAAREHNAKFVDTEHLLLGLLEEELAIKIITDLGIKPDDLKAYIEQNLIEGTESSEQEKIDFSPRAKKALEQAFYSARELGHNYVGSEHILLGLIREGEGMAAQVLKKYGIDENKIKKVIIKDIGKGKEAPAKSTTPNLDKFSIDLTAQAKEGKLDPVIGRLDEITRVIHILSRRTKNNPVLIGEPGVGKTAIAEGLAQRIVSGNIPENLKGKRVVALDLSSAVAGTKYRGEFEKRLKKVIEDIKKSTKEIILFIDELHTIVGAGGAEGAIDASNILKPALARGELQTIGATTLNEYRKYIEKDAALERRFQPVLVNEPTVEVSIEILRGLRDKYEAHHRVKITDAAIIQAANLADRYITDRFLPDKAIDLIDEAAAKVRLASITTPDKLKELNKEIKRLEKEKEAAGKAKNNKKALVIDKDLKERQKEKDKLEKAWQKERGTGDQKVTPADVEEIVAKWKGIPVAKLAEEETEKLLKLESRLHEKIIGQEEAVQAVAEAIRRGQAGLKDPKRPIGSFIFLGPTGVGKTELTKALAALMFGDEEAMIRIDMSEYMERHSVSRLVGSPPGYVGHEEGGQLTEKVRQKPYSVILLDEIEKAHPDVFNVLLQILEDGRLTDSKGRTVDFKNTVIIATSNIGSERIQEMSDSIGFDEKKGRKKSASEEPESYDEIKKELNMELKKTFRPEFLNRIDEIIVFHSLDRKQMRQIVELMIKEVEMLLRGQNIGLEVTAKAKDLLVKEGYDPSFGARPLRRVIQQKIETPLSTSLLKGTFQSGDTIKVDSKKTKTKEEFTFAKKKGRTTKNKKKLAKV